MILKTKDRLGKPQNSYFDSAVFKIIVLEVKNTGRNRAIILFIYLFNLLFTCFNETEYIKVYQWKALLSICCQNYKGGQWFT